MGPRQGISTTPNHLAIKRACTGTCLACTAQRKSGLQRVGHNTLPKGVIKNSTRTVLAGASADCVHQAKDAEHTRPQSKTRLVAAAACHVIAAGKARQRQKPDSYERVAFLERIQPPDETETPLVYQRGTRGRPTATGPARWCRGNGSDLV
jgi:hypothetical protein